MCIGSHHLAIDIIYYFYMIFLQKLFTKQIFTLALAVFTVLSTTAQTNNALIIGIDDYSQISENLKSPVNDAKELKSILKSKYQFKTVRMLENQLATKENIFKCIKNFQDELTEYDHLLIFYSGLAIENDNQGYWLPANTDDKGNLSALVSTNEITKKLNNIKSKQILIITNAYFGYNDFEPSEFFHKQNGKKINFDEQINDFKGRQVITSGGVQPILEEDGIYSEFGKQLITFLKNPTSTAFDAFSLFQYLKLNIENIPSEPEIGHLKNINHEGGQFVFRAEENLCQLEIAEGEKVTYFASGMLTANSSCEDCQYEWYLNDKVISEKNEVIVSNTNNYKVIMTNDNNCKIVKTVAVTIEKEKLVQSDPMEDN